MASTLAAAAPALAQDAPTPASPSNNRTQSPPSQITERPTGPASLEGLPILRVEVVGNTRTDTRLITDQVRAQSGQAYSHALVDVDVRAVAALDRFITVRAEVEPSEDTASHLLKGVIVRFVVEERPVVAAVELVGNRKFTDTQIRDALILRAGSSIDPFSIQTDIKTILDMYRKQGYAQAGVTSDETALKNGVVRYTITEGPQSKINAVKFDGNVHVKGSLLRWKIASKPTFWIFRKGLLDEDKVQQDLVTIRDTYLKRGYIDARVSSSLDYTEDKAKLTLRFAIVEGPQYKIGKIKSHRQPRLLLRRTPR